MRLGVMLPLAISAAIRPPCVRISLLAAEAMGYTNLGLADTCSA